MIAGKLKMPWGKIVKENLTLEVELFATGLRLAKFRMWLGAQIMKLATIIVGCEIEINKRNDVTESMRMIGAEIIDGHYGVVGSDFLAAEVYKAMRKIK